MHMADALLSPAVAGTMYACSTAVAAYSVTKIRKEDDQTKIPTMGIMGAFVFAAQMINFTIPGTGSFRTFVRRNVVVRNAWGTGRLPDNDRYFADSVFDVC